MSKFARSKRSEFVANADDLLQVIKRYIMHAKKTAFIVEHDFIMAAYLADRVIVYDGQPSARATARAPQSLLTGGLLHPDLASVAL